MAKPLSYFQNILTEIKTKEQNFVNECNLSVQNLRSWLDNQFQNTQKVLAQSEKSCSNLKIESNRNRCIAQNNKFKVQEIQNWIGVNKESIDLQLKELQMVTQLGEKLKRTKEEISLKRNALINKQNEKKMRLDKVDQFIKTCQNSNPTNHQIQRRLYTPKSRQVMEPDIEFRPQNRELVFRIQTFEGKIAEFILFFDQEERKYGLKNSFKNLKSLDILAVKNFNVHHDKLRLYKEFKAIIVKCYDNAESDNILK